MRVHEARVRVRYAETDQMGVVYHANYLVWMEVGRVEFCRAAGLRYKDLEAETEIHLAVAEASCRYLQPAKYDDEVLIRTSVAQAHSRMVVFHYELVNAESGAVLATGLTKHVFLGRDLRPRKLPAEHWAIFGVGG
jgi:acyl-CoA thioester hydrolase